MNQTIKLRIPYNSLHTTYPIMPCIQPIKQIGPLRKLTPSLKEAPKNKCCLQISEKINPNL